MKISKQIDCLYPACFLIILLFSTYSLSQPNKSHKNVGNPDPVISAQTTVYLDPSATPFSSYRWRDVAGNLYSETYRDNYVYNIDVLVQIDFEQNDVTFNGQLTATGLKPNFAYQLKISGSSGTPSNELIGLAGRWWQEEWDGIQWGSGQNLNNKGDGLSPTPNDDLYFLRRDEEDPSSPTGFRYRFSGYLVFDYFITDENGDASFAFEANNSYHVLWNTIQRVADLNNDGPQKSATFNPDPAQNAYDTDYPQTMMTIFGEWERLPAGKIFLGPGAYDCQIILTEESFHNWPTDSSFTGQWAAAMGADIQFNIAEDDPLPVQLSSFRVVPGNSCLIVKWVTESEIHHAGFEILRSASEKQNYISISSYQNNPDLIGQGGSSIKHEYVYRDHDVLPGQSYWYQLVDIDLSGQRTYHGPVQVYLTNNKGLNHLSFNIPEELRLYPNFPNPFNSMTVIRFEIPLINQVPNTIRLAIYNSSGQKVRVLYKGEVAAGSFGIAWDGRSDQGKSVSSGVYFIVLRLQDRLKTGKMILMK